MLSRSASVLRPLQLYEPRAPGSRQTKRAPVPGPALSARMVPPWASISARAIVVDDAVLESLEVRIDGDERLLVVDDEHPSRGTVSAGGRPARCTLIAHSSIFTKRPCHQCSQTAPVSVLTESIPVIAPRRSVWKVR